MAENTKIEWATHTFNPWIGCSKVHTGCEHCYAEAQSGRQGVKWGPHGTRRRTSERYWKQPLKWEREAQKFEHWSNWERPRVFPSLCDVFDEWTGDIVDSHGEKLRVDYPEDTTGRRPMTLDNCL